MHEVTKAIFCLSGHSQVRLMMASRAMLGMVTRPHVESYQFSVVLELKTNFSRQWCHNSFSKLNGWMKMTKCVFRGWLRRRRFCPRSCLSMALMRNTGNIRDSTAMHIRRCQTKGGQKYDTTGEAIGVLQKWNWISFAVRLAPHLAMITTFYRQMSARQLLCYWLLFSFVFALHLLLLLAFILSLSSFLSLCLSPPCMASQKCRGLYLRGKVHYYYNFLNYNCKLSHPTDRWLCNSVVEQIMQTELVPATRETTHQSGD